MVGINCHQNGTKIKQTRGILSILNGHAAVFVRMKRIASPETYKGKQAGPGKGHGLRSMYAFSYTESIRLKTC